MVNEPTVRKLHEMRLAAMAESFQKHWLLVSLKESEARDLLEIVEARHQTGSTIFCSQFAPGGWHSKIGESTLADAILDRIVHSSYTITIEGTDSMRKRKGLIQ